MTVAIRPNMRREKPRSANSRFCCSVKTAFIQPPLRGILLRISLPVLGGGCRIENIDLKDTEAGPDAKRQAIETMACRVLLAGWCYCLLEDSPLEVQELQTPCVEPLVTIVPQ